MKSRSPPEYVSYAVYGISCQTDELIMGKTPLLYFNSCARTNHLMEKAQLHKSKIIEPLTATKKALAHIFNSHEQSRPYLKLSQVFARISLAAAVVHDIIKTPYHLSRMSIALWKSKQERKKSEKEVVDEILESLCISLETVLLMLNRLDLRTLETLRQEAQSDGFVLFATLARLLEAYGSRFAPSGIVYLASQKRLSKEHCSGIARLHFDQIHELKDLISVGSQPTETLLKASAAIKEWLPRVLRALKGSVVNRNEDPLFYHF
jgi:hypothetical protein